MSVLDTFPPPSLDVAKWTDYFAGSTASQVGFPEDGYFVHGVDDSGDHVYVESKSKISLPANKYFSVQIMYKDIYYDADQDIRYYFGYRSNQQDGGGNPLYGVDLMLLAEPGGVFFFQQRVIVGGVETISNLLADPTGGADGGFKVIRNGTVYSLYRFDGRWTPVVDVGLGFSGPGYIRFGVMAENVGLAAFPWVAKI